jgi:hypothetical protein
MTVSLVSFPPPLLAATAAGAHPPHPEPNVVRQLPRRLAKVIRANAQLCDATREGGREEEEDARWEKLSLLLFYI